MPPVRLLHAADLHLDGPVAAPDPELAGLAAQARRRSLERLVALAREQEVQVVLLAGDVFHTPDPPLAALLMLQQALAAWVEAGARVFIAPGNHDPWQAGSVWDQWRPLEGVHVFAPQAQGVALEELGLWVAGAAHDSSQVEADLAPGLPAPPPGLSGVALLHADLPSSRQTDAHQPYAPTRLERLTSAPFAYWALGHWHQPRELAARPRVVMAGTPQGAHLGESGPHGAWLVELEDGAARARFVANAPLVFHDFVLDDLVSVGDPAALKERVARALASPDQPGQHAACLRLALRGPSPLWRQLSGEQAADGAAALKQALGLAGLVLDSRCLAPPVDARDLARREDVLGGLLRLLDRAAGDADFMAELEERLRLELHPSTRDWDPARRQEWLRELIAEARSLALRDLWLGEGGA